MRASTNPLSLAHCFALDHALKRAIRDELLAHRRYRSNARSRRLSQLTWIKAPPIESSSIRGVF